MESAFQQHEEAINKSRERLFLPVLPKTTHSPNNPVIFKHKKFVKSNTRVNYKNRAMNILDDSIRLHGNIQELTKDKLKSSDLGCSSERFKRRYFSRCLANDVLLRRDRWVQCIYFTLHKLNVYSKEQIAKIQLSTDDDRLEAILGTACHAKGWTPYFPEFCFTNGIKEFPFDRSGKQRRPKIVNPCLEGHAIYPCLGICIPASDGQALKVLDILEKCQNLNRKQLRQFLMTLNKCSVSQRTPYLQTVEKRNHPIDCYSGENLCPSDLVVLRKLNPHYTNVRKLYQILSELKNMHEMVADLDAAVACGDFVYLKKLLAYMPPEKPSKVHAVERPNTIVNHKTMAEKYGKHLLNFYKNIDLNLPRTACICCEKLTDDAHIQTISARRKNLGNLVWQQLLAYLNSHTRTVTRGEACVDSLIGQTICSSCSGELNKNKIPTISIMNGMDTGSQPDCIASLSEFESIFIHLAMCYQTIIKLTPMGANLPYSTRMDKLKGFAVHITQPLNSAITELFGNRPSKLVDPDEYIVLHGIPKKDRAVWQRLVSVDKIHAALVWLKDNNPLYHKIEIPENPIDLLPPDVATDNADRKCDAGKHESSDSHSCNETISSNTSLPEFDAHDDMPRSGPEMAPASDVDISSGDSDSDTDGLSFHHVTRTSSDNEIDSDKSGSDGDQKDSRTKNINDKTRNVSGGCSEAEQEREKEMDEDESEMLDATELEEYDIEKINNMETQKEKLKFIIIKNLLGYARQLPVLGHVCDSCTAKLRKVRTHLTKRLGSELTIVNHNSIDLQNMAEFVAKHKAAVKASSSNLPMIVCTLCKCRPNSKKLTSKRCKKFQKISENCESFKYEIKELQTDQIDCLTKIDELRTNGYLCKSCHVKYNQYCMVSNFKLESKNEFEKVLKKSASKIFDCHSKLDVFISVAEQFKDSEIESFCVKCNKSLNSNDRVLPSLSSNVTVDNADAPSNSSPIDQESINELHFSMTDDNYTIYEYLGSIKVYGSGAHSANVKRTLSLNEFCINQFINILALVKQHEACCKTCVGTVEGSLKILHNILKSRMRNMYQFKKFEGKHSLKFNLEYIDVDVYKSLLFDALDRFKRVATKTKCYECSANLKHCRISVSFVESLEQSIIHAIESI